MSDESLTFKKDRLTRDLRERNALQGRNKERKALWSHWRSVLHLVSSREMYMPKDYLSYQRACLQRRIQKKEKGLVLTSRVFAFLLQVPKHSAHAPFVPIVLHFRIITTKNKWQARSYNSTWSEGEASPYKQPFSTFHIFRNDRADFHSPTFFWSFLPQTPLCTRFFHQTESAHSLTLLRGEKRRWQNLLPPW